MSAIKPITMPKWGLAMEEGTVARWGVTEGATIAPGQEILDIETAKIANVYESPVEGVLRRRVAGEGETLPVGGLIGVVADPSIPDAELDAFVASFQERFKREAVSGPSAPQPESVVVGGMTIRYLASGPEDGTDAVVMIHGFGGDHTAWMFNQGDISAERRVIAFDLPGHGGSSKDVGRGDVHALAEAIAAALAALGVQQAHLVGHSLGGGIATALAASGAGLAASLALIAPTGLGADINMTFIDGFISETRPRKLRGVLEALVADPSLITPEMVEQIVRAKRLDGATEALTRIAAAAFAGGRQALDQRAALNALDVPRLIIWGEDDQILPFRHGEGLEREIVVTRMRGAGHVPQMEQAAAVNAALGAHFARAR